MTEQQCAGQEKRDTVGCEAAYWVHVLKDGCQCGREGMVYINGYYIFSKCWKIKNC